MRLLIVGICATVLLAQSVITAQAPTDLVGHTFAARVVGVVDGDTLDVVRANTGRKIRIRLDGIDTPESGEPFSQQARNLTRVLAFDADVSVAGKDVDRYGRLVARILASGKDLSTEVVLAGLACHFLRYSSDPRLAAAEASARMSGLGFWAAGAPKPRCVSAAGTARPTAAPVNAAGGFFGNVRSRVYHAPTCKNAHCKNCTRHFTDRDSAERAGFRAAGDCLPRLR